MSKLFHPTHNKRILFFVILDIFLFLTTLYLSFNLRFSFEVPPRYLEHFFKTFILLATFKVAFLFYFNIYKVAWRFFSLVEAKKIFLAHFFSYILFMVIFLFMQENYTPFARSILIIDAILSLSLIGIFRMSKRLFIESKSNPSFKKTLIIGANQIAQNFIKDPKTYYVCEIVDNDTSIMHSHISNLQVKNYNNIKQILQQSSIEAVIIAKELTKIELNKLHEILQELSITDIKVATLDASNRLKNLSVEDLLARKPKDLDLSATKEFIDNKSVLITGAGGSIGSQLAILAKKFNAKKIILLDNNEFNLYTINEKLSASNVICIMANVQHYEILENIIKKHKPEIILHAAAYKHVPLCEENVDTCVENNIFGTKNVIDLAIKYEVSKFVLISTDKAVRPTNVMGATKRVCELYAHAIPSQKTEISAVRFGNVLGSSGSVIPKFKRQIENNENLSVTHKDITRYFMLISEACQLVLQAASMAKGGELFILDMGEPVKILDLAKKMIELSGKNKLGIKFTGLRAGEKLYEELLISKDSIKTKYSSIMVSKNSNIELKKLNTLLEKLQISTNKIAILQEIVPEFTHKI